MKLTPLKARIVAAPRRRLSYHALALHLRPPETNPRAWRRSSNGGPHGWAMPLGRALRELHTAQQASELAPVGGGPGHGDVILLCNPDN